MRERWKVALYAALAWLVLCAVGIVPARADELAECTFDAPIELRVKVYPNEDALARRYLELAGTHGRRLVRIDAPEGFATVQGNVHTLHVLAPRSRSDRERLATLGHELLHAFCGDWHPDSPE